MELTSRQQDILQAAITVIARQGLKDLTTKNLAKQMKLTEAALYRHYTSKADLIQHILVYFEELSAKVITEIDSRKLKPLECIRSFVMNRYLLFASKPDLAKVMFSEEFLKTDPSLTYHMQTITHSHMDAIVHYIKKAQTSKDIRKELDPSDIFRIIVGSMRFTVSQWNNSGQSFDLVQTGEKLFNTIIKLIEVKK